MVIGQFSERCSLVNTIDFGAATSNFTEESQQLVSKGKLSILDKCCSVVAVALASALSSAAGSAFGGSSSSYTGARFGSNSFISLISFISVIPFISFILLISFISDFGQSNSVVTLHLASVES